jgi:hypothetical protein
VIRCEDYSTSRQERDERFGDRASRFALREMAHAIKDDALQLELKNRSLLPSDVDGALQRSAPP